jgi:hypothetical protein
MLKIEGGQILFQRKLQVGLEARNNNIREIDSDYAPKWNRKCVMIQSGILFVDERN